MFRNYFHRALKLGNMSKKLMKMMQDGTDFSTTRVALDASTNGKHESAEANMFHFFRFPTKPVKSPNDKKEYSVIKLENGLVALLISDLSSPGANNIISDFGQEEMVESSSSEEESAEEDNNGSGESGDMEPVESRTRGKDEVKLAACSLTVGAGSFNDPEEIPGMAHFVEHMLFMGSQKYPQENYFDSYIKKKGGGDNAFTECEATTYYFECPEQNFSKAMDVFANLFTAPLMTESAITREREAVESEFNENSVNDENKRQQLLQMFATTGHPAGKFVWGNLKTLRDGITDSELHAAAHTFWKTYYSSDKITVAVQARLPLELLEKMVTKHFSNVPHSQIKPPKLNLPSDPFDSSKFHKYYFLQTIKDDTVLQLNWVMPPIKELYRTMPQYYITWLLCHGGKGSLSDYLRNVKQWATSITAGDNDDDLLNNDYYSMYNISIHLSELGGEHLESVIEAVFSYIKLMRNEGPQERLFKEMQTVAELGFRFEEESSAVDNVEELSGSMQLFPIEHYLNGCKLLFEYKPEEIKTFMNYLSPKTVNIMYSRNQHDAALTLDEIEPWFKTNFTSKDIPEERIEKWTNIEVYPQFHMPEPNNFIASDFTLHTNPDGFKYPEKIYDTRFDLWHKLDNKFHLPNAIIGVQFYDESCMTSIRQKTILQLYADILTHVTMKELYPAKMALMEYRYKISNGTLSIELTGFNEKIPMLLNKIAGYIRNFNNLVTANIFNINKEWREKVYYNNNLNITSLCTDLRLALTNHNNYTTACEHYNEIKNISIEEVKHFSNVFFKKSNIQCLVQGNLVKEEAVRICKDFVEKIRPDREVNNPLPTFLLPKLPHGDHSCRIQAFNNKEPNCVTTNYYQYGAAKLRQLSTLDLIKILIEEPLFDQLRTQEQLGYDVNCDVREMGGILGFSVTIVSQIEKQCVDHIEERITDFLKNQLRTLKKISVSDFNEAVNSLIALKKCSDHNLREEFSRNKSQIMTGEYVFDRLEQEQKVLESITPNELVSVLEQLINPKNNEFRKLSVSVVGYPKGEEANPSTISDNEIKSEKNEALPSELHYKIMLENPRRKDCIVIDDIKRFRSQLEYYPKNSFF